MSNVNTILSNVAGRLGLGEETAVIKKSDEFLRVLNSKAKVMKHGDFARAVLCLDLSCTFFGIGFDKETALILSGLKKGPYQNSFNMLQKVLDLDKPISISEACVLLSCTVVKELASQILESYRQSHQMADISHPQYIAASIYTACKLKAIKVQKSQFVSISRLKPMQWKQLEEAFLKFAQNIGINVSKPAKKSTKNELHEQLEEFASNQENIQMTKTKASEEIDIEDYDVWKARIIAAAKQSVS